MEKETQIKFVQILAKACELAEPHKLGSEPVQAIVARTRSELREAASGLDRLELIANDEGLLCAKRTIPTDSPGARQLLDRFGERGIKRLSIPRLISPGSLWALLLVLSRDPRIVAEAGGAKQAISVAGGGGIAVEEQPTVLVLGESLGVVHNEQADTFMRATQEIVRSFQMDGPDAVAMGLLMVWRRIQTEHKTAGLPVEEIAAILPRLDPIVTFTVLSRLTGSPDGAAISTRVSDMALAESISAVIVSKARGVENSSLALLHTARPDHSKRAAVLVLIQQRLAQAGRETDPIWLELLKKANPDGVVQDPRIADLLRELETTEDKSIRRRLCDEIVALGERAVPAVKAAGREGPWYFLRNLLKILGGIGSPAGEETVLRLLRHAHKKVRFEAIRALGKIGTHECLSLLGDIAGAKGEKPQRAAFGPQGRHIEQEVVNSFRKEAIAVLGHSHIPQAVPLLEVLLTEPPVPRRAIDDVRREAARALNIHASPAAGRVLSDAVRSSNRSIRTATEEILRNRK